jgi:hypothetical protein
VKIYLITLFKNTSTCAGLMSNLSPFTNYKAFVKPFASKGDKYLLCILSTTPNIAPARSPAPSEPTSRNVYENPPCFSMSMAASSMDPDTKVLQS